MNISAGSRHAVRYKTLGVTPGLKNTWYLFFPILKVIFLQNDWLAFVHESHNWHLSTCKSSFVFEVLQSEKLEIETRFNFAEKYWSGNFRNRKSNTNFSENTGLFSLTKLLLNYCYLEETWLVVNFSLFSFPIETFLTVNCKNCVYACSTLIITFFQKNQLKNVPSSSQLTVFKLKNIFH